MMGTERMPAAWLRSDRDGNAAHARGEISAVDAACARLCAEMRRAHARGALDAAMVDALCASLRRMTS